VTSGGTYNVSWNATLNGACSIGVIVNGVEAPALKAGSQGGPVQAAAIVSLAAGDVLALSGREGSGCFITGDGSASGSVSAAMTIVKIN